MNKVFESWCFSPTGKEKFVARNGQCCFSTSEFSGSDYFKDFNKFALASKRRGGTIHKKFVGDSA